MTSLSKLKCDQPKNLNYEKNQFLTIINSWQNFKKSFGKNNLTPQQLMRCTQGRALRSCNVFWYWCYYPHTLGGTKIFCIKDFLRLSIPWCLDIFFGKLNSNNFFKNICSHDFFLIVVSQLAIGIGKMIRYISYINIGISWCMYSYFWLLLNLSIKVMLTFCVAYWFVGK